MGAQAGSGPGRKHVKMPTEGGCICICACVQECVHVCACVCVGADGGSIHSSTERSDSSCQMLATPKDYPQLGSPPTTGCECSPSIHRLPAPGSPGQQSPPDPVASLCWLLPHITGKSHRSRSPPLLGTAALTFDFSAPPSAFSHGNTKQIGSSVSRKCPSSFSQSPSHEGPPALLVSYPHILASPSALPRFHHVPSRTSGLCTPCSWHITSQLTLAPEPLACLPWVTWLAATTAVFPTQQFTVCVRLAKANTVNSSLP